MAGKRAAADVLAEWEQKMKEKAAQAQGAASGAYDQLTQGGVEPDAIPLAKRSALPKGVVAAPGSPYEAVNQKLLGQDVAQAQGYAQGASMGRGAQDIYDQVQGQMQSMQPGSIGSMMDTVKNGMPSGAEIGGVARGAMENFAKLPPQIQQQIQQAVQSGQVTMEEVAQQLQQMGGAVAQQAGNVMADPAYEAKLMQIQGTAMPARPGPYPDAGGFMTRNAEAINSNMLPPGMMQQPGGTGAMENQIISKLQEMGVPITPENVRMYMKMKAGAQGMFDKAKGLMQ